MLGTCRGHVRISGRANQVDDLRDTRLCGVATLGRDTRLEAEPRQAEQYGLQNVVVVFVERAVYERASIEVGGGGQWMLSTVQRGLVAAGVALANAAVRPVDEYLAALIARNPSRDIDRFLLAIETARDPPRARFANRPLAPAWYNVLACSHGRAPVTTRREHITLPKRHWQSVEEHEERRALETTELFVAMTRARDGLFLLCDDEPHDAICDGLGHIDESRSEIPTPRRAVASAAARGVTS